MEVRTNVCSQVLAQFGVPSELGLDAGKGTTVDLLEDDDSERRILIREGKVKTIDGKNHGKQHTERLSNDVISGHHYCPFKSSTAKADGSDANGLFIKNELLESWIAVHSFVYNFTRVHLLPHYGGNMNRGCRGIR